MFWPLKLVTYNTHTYEVAVVLTLQSVAGPCKSGFQRWTAEDLPAECRNWRLFFDGIYYCWDTDLVLRLVLSEKEQAISALVVRTLPFSVENDTVHTYARSYCFEVRNGRRVRHILTSA